MGRALACVTNKAKKQTQEYEEQIAELREHLAEALAASAAYREVLLGLEFNELDRVVKEGAEYARALGEHAAEGIKAIIAERDSLRSRLTTIMMLLNNHIELQEKLKKAAELPNITESKPPTIH